MTKWGNLFSTYPSPQPIPGISLNKKGLSKVFKSRDIPWSKSKTVLAIPCTLWAAPGSIALCDLYLWYKSIYHSFNCSTSVVYLWHLWYIHCIFKSLPRIPWLDQRHLYSYFLFTADKWGRGCEYAVFFSMPINSRADALAYLLSIHACPVRLGQFCIQLVLCCWWLLPSWWSPWLRCQSLCDKPVSHNQCAWAVRVSACSKSSFTAPCQWCRGQPAFACVNVF